MYFNGRLGMVALANGVRDYQNQIRVNKLLPSAVFGHGCFVFFFLGWDK
jgi:hypothetical protein